ncbi:hypothetical protein K488DRAFT_85290 [Vararia minispora EC-137]|uniref:Uncharacterized protein n=1 Tax=Vararia minispora EC-137 TaxID=1314806 RepID=A0ACB8QMJ4_9AGAM|nr:hypothetical protein K488DRAFT_85290 [Vararia minispora EC-137]
MKLSIVAPLLALLAVSASAAPVDVERSIEERLWNPAQQAGWKRLWNPSQQAGWKRVWNPSQQAGWKRED